MEALQHIIPALILCCQFTLFFLLSIIGLFCEVLYVEIDRIQYASYSSTYFRLAELKTTITDSCSNLTNLPCSLQMHINIYFFWTKFILVYHSLIIIAMIYTWHLPVFCFICYDRIHFWH